MNRLIFFLRINFFLMFLSVQLFGQNHRISGFVFDMETGEKLIGASLIDLKSFSGTATNNNGYFSFKTEGDSIKVSFIGYRSELIRIENDTVIEVYLNSGQLIKEVNIVNRRFKNSNISRLSNQELMTIPSITGKPDVIKALQLTPGIEIQAEGTSILNVRGGSPGENLYLIDDVQLIYVNHIGGFYSVLNPDMMNNMEVYKGAFPAKYGGKLSSVLSITQREGNKKNWNGNLGIGVTDASFTLEGPILKDKMSVIVTGRKTLIDAPLALVTATQNDVFVYYGFHDWNAKWSYKPNKSNSFNINYYYGDDYLKYMKYSLDPRDDRLRYINKWGNYLLSGKWSKRINDRLFVNNTLSLTRYRLKIRTIYIPNGNTSKEKLQSIFLSSVQDASFRSDWNYHLFNRWTIDFGAKLSYLKSIPNKTEYSEEVVQKPNIHRPLEIALYQNNELTLTRNMKADLGLRYAKYINGTYSIDGLEPRMELIGLLGNQQFSVNFQNVNQYSHLLFTSGSIFNKEVWITADEEIPPSHSLQYGLSWNGSFHNGMIDAEINLYKKLSTKLATYKEGYATILGDGNWKSKIETGGTGKSKGVELMIRKNNGNWTGFISYTFSHTTRQFPGINNGKEFIYDYDRPHSFSITLNHRFNEKLEFNMAWMYQTGLPYTPVVAHHLTFFLSSPEEALIYGERNSERMKDYHRLDAALRYTKTGKRGRRVEWCFSIYNLYNRKNANSYYYAYDKKGYSFSNVESLDQLKQYQNSFFPVIPMISYRVNFDDIRLTSKK